MEKLDRFKVRELFLDSFVSDITNRTVNNCTAVDYKLLINYHIIFSLINLFDDLKNSKARYEIFDWQEIF